MRKLSVLALLALAGSVLTVAPAANAQPMATAKMAVEGNLTGPLALSGIRLALYAMPPQTVMNKLHVGDDLQGRLVGEATSSSTGSYEIKISHPAAITSSALNGIVNLEIWAAGNGYISQFGFTRRVGAGTSLNLAKSRSSRQCSLTQ